MFRLNLVVQCNQSGVIYKNGEIWTNAENTSTYTCQFGVIVKTGKHENNNFN